ncbi:HAD-IB family hydrolase [Aliikangiella sp. G2MR2-5]|uniref:HAD-IB family hydrolase n=1 Tax=Aliikangiella sp. G2MR2-5 TaxID=2788943 RepID=UPI0018A8FF2E|nr:HAD-IB family hydrolase [Aliikangiella sp. G2MR2-5]
MKLALFDFDGTITTKDSLEDFIQFAVGKPRYYIGLLLLSPMLVAYLLKLVRNDIAKQMLMSFFFKGWKTKRFEKLANEYSLLKIDDIVRPKALTRLKWHQEKNDKIVIVSASIDVWLKPWCDRNGFELLSTRMESVDDLLTGKFANRNCYGEEKVNKIKSNYQLEEFDFIYAYGDTAGDKPMMALANESFYREFE